MNFSRFRIAIRSSKVNCAEMAGDRPRQPVYKFSALNVDFSSLSPDLLGSRKSAHAGVKKGTPLKSGYLSAVGVSSVKINADRHMLLLIVTSTGDELLRNVNIDNFE